jgi:hypothetical protein
MAEQMIWWATPLLTAVLAAGGAWLAVSLDRRKAINEELIKKRLAVYDEMAPRLNDILCFFFCIGRFQSLPPAEIIKHKRALDLSINLYAPLFSPALRTAYDAMLKYCFVIYAGGTGKPALIAANIETLRKEWDGAWQPAWTPGIVPVEQAVDPDEVRRRYDALMAQLAREVGARG